MTAASVPTSAMAVRVLDLNANDQVAPTCYQSSGGSLILDGNNLPVHPVRDDVPVPVVHRGGAVVHPAADLIPLVRGPPRR